MCTFVDACLFVLRTFGSSPTFCYGKRKFRPYSGIGIGIGIHHTKLASEKPSTEFLPLYKALVLELCLTC